MSKSNRPFSIERRDGILTLSLDTPGCDVNIFDNNAATQLREVLGELDPAQTRAVVLRSGKPGSFVNGVGLLMAVAVKTPAAARELTEHVRSAYQALRDCPVPTVAAIEGNCYGCGVELTLCCDFRVAVDTAPTHFYMTEIADYLFLPIFEATVRLPLLLGLDRAARLLLWGERWSAREAQENGLVDLVVERQQLGDSLVRFVRQQLDESGQGKPPARTSPDRGLPSGHLDALLDEHERRIQRLPPDYQAVYREGLELMADVAQRGTMTPDAVRREIDASGRTSCDPKAKQALSFFFIRQVAATLCSGRRVAQEPALRVAVIGASDEARTLRGELESRSLPGVTVASSGATSATNEARLLLQSGAADVRADATDLEAGIALAVGAPVSWPASTMLHGPFYPPGRPLLEVASREEPTAGTRLLSDYLGRIGISVIISRPGERYAIDELLLAYFAPLVRYCTEGGHAQEVNASLRDFGFIRWPHHILEGLGGAGVVEGLLASAGLPREQTGPALQQLQSPDYEDGRSLSRVTDALCGSLIAAANRLRSDGVVGHPSLTDLIARETLDFPLQHGSLGTYGTKSRIRELLRQTGTLRDLLAPRDLAQLERAMAGRKETYL